MNRRRAAASRGFAIVAVLLLVALIATISATYVRHVVVEAQGSPGSRTAVGSLAAVQSGLEYARKAAAVGKPLATTTVVNGEHQATLSVSTIADDHARYDLQSLDGNGLGTTLLAEASRVPVALPDAEGPDDLPRLDEASVSALLGDASIPQHVISGVTTLSGTELEGLVVIQDGAALYLDDVLVKGLIVTETTLSADSFGDYDAATVPYLVIDGNVRIESSPDVLPGVAIVMPDGIVTTWTSDARLQIDGDLVAHTVMLNRPGSVRGNIAHVAPLELHAELERPGAGRTPEPWSDGLAIGDSFEDEYMAFLPRYSSVGDLPAITSFWQSGGAGGN